MVNVTGTSEWWVIATHIHINEFDPGREPGIKLLDYTATWLTNEPSNPTSSSRWIPLYEEPTPQNWHEIEPGTPKWDYVDWTGDHLQLGIKKQQEAISCLSESRVHDNNQVWIPDQSYFKCEQANLNNTRQSWEPNKDTSTAYGSTIIDAVDVVADKYGFYHVLVARLEHPTAPLTGFTDDGVKKESTYTHVEHESEMTDIVIWVWFQSNWTTSHSVFEVRQDWTGDDGYGTTIPWGPPALASALKCIQH